MAGIAAYHLLKKTHTDVAAPAIRVAVTAGLVFSILVAFPFGHHHAAQVAKTQPEKFAAIEGLYTSADSAPLVMFALPFTAPPELKANIEIPGLMSWLAFGDVHAPVKGLDEFPADEVPQGAELWLSFVSFHNMVILGTLFIGLMALAVFYDRRGSLAEKPGYSEA